MRLLLGITGGIAAYKTPDLVRRLRERGADVRVVMTRSAHRFVTATSLQAVAGVPVRDDLWDADAEAAMGHIELARWADRVLVAPATADFLSKLSNGAADDLLTTLCLATRAPIDVAPAMNNVMWANAAVRANCERLAERGIRFLGPADGAQACGEWGPGRMLEPAEIADAVTAGAAVDGPLAGRTVFVTAGPTREAIDPVRYISNHSSGKMGYAMAEAARDAGAQVLLFSGPVNLPVPARVERIDFETAADLYEAVHARVADCDVFVATAAVADYRPAESALQKLKKTKHGLRLELVRTRDVLASVAALPRPPFTVGFAAETDKLREHALAKLDGKNLDMIVGNQVGNGLAFGRDDNSVQVFWRGGEREFPLARKTELSRQLVSLIAERFAARTTAGAVTELPARTARD